MKRNEEILKNLWDTIKKNNQCPKRVPEEEMGEKWIESLFKQIIADNFPNMGRDLDIQVLRLIGNSRISIKKVFSKTHYNKMSKMKKRGF